VAAACRFAPLLGLEEEDVRFLPEEEAAVLLPVFFFGVVAIIPSFLFVVYGESFKKSSKIASLPQID
jgi:hypothetical protein